GEFIAHWPDVQYEYVVGDRGFVGGRIMFTHRGFGKSETQRLVDAYPVNKLIAVYFDPRSPEAAVLQPGGQWFFIPILTFAIILMVLMVWIIYVDLLGQLSSRQGRSHYLTSGEHATKQTQQYHGAIVFIVAIGFAAIFYKVLFA